MSVATTTWYASATAEQVTVQSLVDALATLRAWMAVRSRSVVVTTWNPIAIAWQSAHWLASATARLTALMVGLNPTPSPNRTLKTVL